MLVLRDLFKHPSVEALRARQLEEAKHHLLAHQANAEYHAAMVVMLKARIVRLVGEQKLEAQQ